MINQREAISNILKLRNEGLNQAEIAQRLGFSQAYVSRLSKKGNIDWPIGAAARDQYGSNNPMYKDGTGRSTIERLTRHILINEGRDLFTCERCSYKSAEEELHRHHKDRDRTNNISSNLEVLCTYCHHSEHILDRERDTFGRFTA